MLEIISWWEMVCIPDGRWSGWLLSLRITYFPTHQTSVMVVDRLQLVVHSCWREFPPAEPQKLWVTRVTCRTTVPKSCLSTAVAVVPQERDVARKHFNGAPTGSQPGVLPAPGSVTHPVCTTDQCWPSTDFTMTSAHLESTWHTHISIFQACLVETSNY